MPIFGNGRAYAQTIKLKASIKPPKKSKVRKHRTICYESESPATVKVTRKGVIRALAAGKTKVHVYAQNGICKTITVTVK